MNIIFKHSATKFASIHLTEELLSLYNGDVESALNASVPDTIDEFVEITDDQLNKARQLPLEDWRIVDGEFVVEPNLERMKSDVIAEIRHQHSDELDKLDLDHSDLNVIRTQNEKITWGKQQEWAERYLENPDDLDARGKLEGMLTDNEIAALKADKLPLATTMANNILTEVYKKEDLIVAANKMRRTAEEVIHTATTYVELEAIKEQLKVQKETTLAGFIAGIEERE